MIDESIKHKENVEKDYKESLNLGPSARKNQDQNENNKINNTLEVDIDNGHNAIVDITDMPDVAVWSKQAREKVLTPADKVRQDSQILSLTIHIEDDTTKHGLKGSKTKMSSNSMKDEQLIDPANKEEVAKAIKRGSYITDKSDLF